MSVLDEASTGLFRSLCYTLTNDNCSTYFSFVKNKKLSEGWAWRIFSPSLWLPQTLQCTIRCISPSTGHGVGVGMSGEPTQSLWCWTAAGHISSALLPTRILYGQWTFSPFSNHLPLSGFLLHSLAFKYTPSLFTGQDFKPIGWQEISISWFLANLSYHQECLKDSGSQSKKQINTCRIEQKSLSLGLLRKSQDASLVFTNKAIFTLSQIQKFQLIQKAQLFQPWKTWTCSQNDPHKSGQAGWNPRVQNWQRHYNMLRNNLSEFIFKRLFLLWSFN